MTETQQRLSERRESLKKFGYVLVEEAVPPIGHSVTVVTSQFRCMGYLDQSMNWRYVRDHGLIREVLAWGVLNPEEKLGRQ